MACKDESGIEQQLAVPAAISWPELLQKLQATLNSQPSTLNPEP